MHFFIDSKKRVFLLIRFGVRKNGKLYGSGVREAEKECPERVKPIWRFRVSRPIGMRIRRKENFGIHNLVRS